MFSLFLNDFIDFYEMRLLLLLFDNCRKWPRSPSKQYWSRRSVIRNVADSTWGVTDLITMYFPWNSHFVQSKVILLNISISDPHDLKVMNGNTCLAWTRTICAYGWISVLLIVTLFPVQKCLFWRALSPVKVCRRHFKISSNFIPFIFTAYTVSYRDASKLVVFLHFSPFPTTISNKESSKQICLIPVTEF